MVTLTHGSPGVAEAGLERGGITPLVERSLSSEAIRAWKPSREVYLWAAGTCDVVPERMAWSPRTAGTCSAPSGRA